MLYLDKEVVFLSLIFNQGSTMNAILNLVLSIALLGVIMWAINMFIPMPSIIKTILNIAVAAIAVIYVLQYFGLVSLGIPMLNIF